jgi:hypothetical protein
MDEINLKTLSLPTLACLLTTQETKVNTAFTAYNEALDAMIVIQQELIDRCVDLKLFYPEERKL